MNLPIVLEGERVKLLPMTLEHVAALFASCNDPEIWRYLPHNVESLADMEALVQEALADQATGTEYPFVVYDKELERLVGSTRILNRSVANRNFEIGWTFYSPEVWRSRVNTECKYLLLQYGFEMFNAVRIQLRADVRNERSNRAIARIGAVHEGVFRKDRILPDGYVRDSNLYSIIASEWPAVQDRLVQYLSVNEDKLKYDQIGKTYNATRQPDERIAQHLHGYLDLPTHAHVLDVGAGTGNYSSRLAAYGLKVTALEPSETMRGQGKQHENLVWVEGVAEALPFADDSFDGLICTLATHHFSDLAQSFREMNRVVKPTGKIVIFSADPRICFDTCWIVDYFRDIVYQSCTTQPAQAAFHALFDEASSRQAVIHPFLLPYDLRDKFFFSGWRTPHAYLEDTYRAGISSLAAAPEEVVQPMVQRLQDDLQTGEFERNYSEQLQRTEMECGYFFLVG